MKVGVIDYRMGNLASVSKAFEKVGAETRVSSEPAALDDSDSLVLPGVGNFVAGMRKLKENDLGSFVRDWAASSRPLIGICLGMQLLFEHSEEGETEGLGILPGRVVRLPPGLKVPHIGWNTVRAERSEILGPFDDKSFYFVHSYVCVPDDDLAAGRTDYGGEFVSAVEKKKIFGVQFHPEKSSENGLGLLTRVLKVLA